MKTTKQSATRIDEVETRDGLFEHIERCAKICYAADVDAGKLHGKSFVDYLVARGHTSPLEHASVYLVIPYDEGHYDTVSFYQRDTHTKVSFQITAGTVDAYVSTNYLVIHGANRDSDIDEFMTCYTPWHAHRTSIDIITSIATSRELNRYRTHSICEQSTRYCNFARDKFGRELTFINNGHIDEELLKLYECAERMYIARIDKGVTPEVARDGLPLGLATHLVHTAFDDDWEHFIDQRLNESTGRVTSEMHELATLISGALKRD